MELYQRQIRQTGHKPLLIISSGDLSSLAWTRKQYTDTSAEVHYCALNFRDVMIATGKLNVTTLPFEGKPSDLCKFLTIFLKR